MKIITAHQDEKIVEKASAIIANLCGSATRGYIMKKYSFNGIEEVIRVFEGSYTDCGLGWKTWPCAVLLCRNLIDHPHFKVEGEEVLELGCGPGLVGLVCCKLKAKKVIFTDYNEKVLDVTTKNVIENKCEDIGVVSKLDWREIAISNTHQLSYNKIVGSDIVYDVSIANIFPDVFSKLLKKDKNSQAFIVLNAQRNGIKEFEEGMSKIFKMEKQLQEIDEDTYFLYTMKYII